MYTYLIMLAISLFFAFILMEVKKLESEYISYKAFKIKRIYVEYLLLFMSMLPFLLISGLRRDIGYDYGMVYKRIFNEIAKGTPLFKASDIGYSILNWIIIRFGGGYVWLFFITSAIIIAFFWIGFYQQSKNICLSITMFVAGSAFFISMDGVRQYMGIAIAFFGFKYIKEKSFFKYAIFIVLGSLFHASILMLLPFYFLQFIKISPIVWTIFLVIGSLANGIFRKALVYIIGFTKYYWYVIDRTFDAGDRIFVVRYGVYILMFIIASIFYYKDENKNNKQYRFMYNTLTLVTFLSLNANIIPASHRLCWTLEIVLLLLIPFILEGCKNRWLKYALGVIIIMAFSKMTYNEIVVLRNQGVVPYIFTFMPWVVFR